MVEITVQFLQTQIERVVFSESATMPSDQLRAILELALHAKLFEPERVKPTDLSRTIKLAARPFYDAGAPDTA